MQLLIKLLIFSVFINTLTWIILTPLWQNPDEQAHFAQVQDYAELGYVPSNNNTSFEIDISEQVMGTKRNKVGNNKFTYHPEFKINYSNSYIGHYENFIRNMPISDRKNLVKIESTQNPPLYYWIGAGIYKTMYSTDLFTRVIALRIYSSILLLITIFITYKISKIIFKNNKVLQITYSSLMGFTPMLAHVSSGILPDPLTNLLMTIVILLSLKLINNEVNYKIIFGIIVIVLLGFLTRQQFLISVFILVYPLAYYLRKNKKNILSTFLSTIVLYLLLYIASYSIPVLSFVRQLSIPEIGLPDLAKLFSNTFKEFTFWTIDHTYHEVLPWYWGVYRWLSFSVPHIFYRIINLLTLISIIGIIIKFTQSSIHKTLSQEFKFILFLFYASAIYFLGLFIWDYYFYLNASFSFGIQGRYYFPLIVAHLAILLIGYWHVAVLIFKNYAKYLALILTILMVTFNDLSLYLVTRSYYQTANIEKFITEVSQYKPLFLKGNMILIIICFSAITQLVFVFFLAKYIIKSKNESN